MVRYTHKFENEDFTKKYGSYIEELKNEKPAFLYPVFFILRRTLFVVAIFFAPENSGLQVISLSLFTTLFIMYLFWT